VIADEARATDRPARKAARQRDDDATAALVAADPLALLRERLVEIDGQMARLSRMHRRQGDELAGRLLKTLERERAELLEKADTNE
jgi:hypothetical protein